MEARGNIDIGVPPRIERNLLLFKVTPFTVSGRYAANGRLFCEGLETLLGIGIKSIVQLE
jgi:hypothetical protein